MRIAISAGHGLHIRGASDIIDEYDENVRVMNGVAKYLSRIAGVEVETWTDTVSDNQDENLARIVAWHNDHAFDGTGGDDRLDISVHFNSSNGTTDKPIGTEVYYYSQDELAAAVSTAIARASGLIDRGGKDGSGLYFLRHTDAPALLLEICFVNSRPDCDIYERHFDEICEAIAEELGGTEIGDRPPIRPPVEPPDEDVLFYAKGTCSWFGGEDDLGVSSSEGLAFIYPDDFEQYRHLFLPYQPAGTTGMARRLDSDRVFYVACRWPYEEGVPKSMLRDHTLKALVRANGREFYAYPADWGPHEEETGRAADLSRALMAALEVTTDDVVEVLYPAPD